MPPYSRTPDELALKSEPAVSDVSLRPASSVRYQVMGWLCVAALIAYLSRNSLAAAESTIRGSTGISEKQMGLVMSGFFLSYSLAQIPTGWLADRWGARHALTFFAILWSCATGLFSLASGWVIFLLSRVANGLAQAGLFPASTCTMARWLPATERGLGSGALSSSMAVGAILATSLTGLLLPLLGWRLTLALFAIPGFLWGVGFHRWFRNSPGEHPAVSPGELRLIRQSEAGAPASGQAAAAPEGTPWLALLTSPAMWCINLQQIFRAAGQIFFASWFPTYLQETRGVSVTGSALLTVLPQLAIVLGSPLGGTLSDRILQVTGSRRLSRPLFAAGCLTLCSLIIVGAYWVENVLLAVGLISLGTFWYALGGPCSYSITMDMGGRHVAVVFSTMNMAGNLGAAAFPSLVPYIIEWTGSWDAVLLVFAALFLAAAGSWLLLPASGTVFDHALLGQTTPESSP